MSREINWLLNNQNLKAFVQVTDFKTNNSFVYLLVNLQNVERLKVVCAYVQSVQGKLKMRKQERWRVLSTVNCSERSCRTWLPSRSLTACSQRLSHCTISSLCGKDTANLMKTVNMVHGFWNTHTHYFFLPFFCVCWCLGGVMIRTLDSQSRSFQFDSWLPHCYVNAGQVVQSHVPLLHRHIIW